MTVVERRFIKSGKCPECGKRHRRQVTVDLESDMLRDADQCAAELDQWGADWQPDFTCKTRKGVSMVQYRAGLPERPERIRYLHLDERGYPVPWFVAWIDGKPDFRVVDTPKVAQAWNRHLCWICGQPLGRYVAFTIGPMCVVNRVSSEPPAHRECALYSAQACPHLTIPSASRRDTGLPEGTIDAAGIPLLRNPGMAVVWVVANVGPGAPKAFKVSANQHGGNEGVLFNIGEPHEIYWFREGRNATIRDIEAAIERGLPALRGPAEREGPEAVAELERRLAALPGLIDGYSPALASAPTLL